jgi:peptidoglycan/xylan/chitin deacetylase (PgdA/CDA1 family)
MRFINYLQVNLMKNVITILCLLFASLLVYPQSFNAGASAVREVAISFDDLPTVDINNDNVIKKEITSKLLSTIANQKIPAIGLVNEAKLYSNGKLDSFSVDLLQQWVDAGLELGNHTYSHIDFYKTTLAQQEEEVLKGEKVIKPMLKEKGKTLRYFRYPFLRPNLNTEARQEFELFLKDHDYTLATVSIDNSDWVFALAYTKALAKKDTILARRIAKDYIPYMAEKFAFYEKYSAELFGREIKQILLVHANRLNADYFDEIARMIKKRGYKFISITEALSDPAYKMKATFISQANMPWVHLWPLIQKLKGSDLKRTPLTPAYIMNFAEVTKEN